MALCTECEAEIPLDASTEVWEISSALTAGRTWNCPIVAYGPGDSSLDHTPNEHLDLAEYHQAIATLARVLRLL